MPPHGTVRDPTEQSPELMRYASNTIPNNNTGMVGVNRRTERIGWVWTLVIITIVAAGILVIHSDAAPVPLKATIVVQAAATVASQQAFPVVATSVIPGDIAPYNGPIGPASALYGLKLSLENMDESFAQSPSERIEKQLTHADVRIAEARAELLHNRTQGAEVALAQYREKMTVTTTAASALAPHETDLLHAQEMVAKHQNVLEQLLTTHENNPGLVTAYANSVQLESAFIQKSDQKLERTVMPDNRLMVQVVKVEPALITANPGAAPATPAPLQNTVTITTPVQVKPTPLGSTGITTGPQGTSLSNRPSSPNATPIPQPTRVQTTPPTPTVTPTVVPPPPQVTLSPSPTPTPAAPAVKLTESPSSPPQNNSGNGGKPATGSGTSKG
jgi:hypothetical protein